MFSYSTIELFRLSNYHNRRLCYDISSTVLRRQLHNSDSFEIAFKQNDRTIFSHRYYLAFISQIRPIHTDREIRTYLILWNFSRPLHRIGRYLYLTIIYHSVIMHENFSFSTTGNLSLSTIPYCSFSLKKKSTQVRVQRFFTFNLLGT